MSFSESRTLEAKELTASCCFVGDTGWGASVHDEISVPEQGSPTENVAMRMQQLVTVFEQAIREHPGSRRPGTPPVITRLDKRGSTAATRGRGRSGKPQFEGCPALMAIQAAQALGLVAAVR
jgi:hypothetical protein